jgi:hypothetical protein
MLVKSAMGITVLKDETLPTAPVEVYKGYAKNPKGRLRLT